MRLLNTRGVRGRDLAAVSMLSALLFAAAAVAGRPRESVSIVDTRQGMGSEESVRGEGLSLADVLCVLVQENDAWPRGCRVKTSGGGSSWWDDLGSGSADFAVVRSDEQQTVWKRQARTGQAVQGDLRHLYSLEMQPLLLLVPDRSPVRRLEDLAEGGGKHYFFGDDRDQETLAAVAEGLMGRAVEPTRTTQVSELVDGLCAETVDGALWWMIAPSVRSLGRIFGDGKCRPRVIPLDSDKARGLSDRLSYLGRGGIPAGTFTGQDTEMETLGLATTVVSSREVPERSVYQFMDVVFKDFYRLQSLYLPAVSVDPWLFPRKVYYDYQSAPLHEGAGRYFRDRLQGNMDLQWVVLGSFKGFAQAEQLARLLAETYRDDLPGGLQVRLDSSGLFGVIAGSAAPRDEAQRRRNLLMGTIVGIRNAVLRDAFLGWSPQLLPQQPRIYPHAANQGEKVIAASLSKRLGDKGWQVLGIEETGKKSPSTSQLRYFRQSERLVAEKIFEDLGGSESGLHLQYVPGYEYSARIRAMHFEIWIAARTRSGERK